MCVRISTCSRVHLYAYQRIKCVCFVAVLPGLTPATEGHLWTENQLPGAIHGRPCLLFAGTCVSLKHFFPLQLPQIVGLERDVWCNNAHFWFYCKVSLRYAKEVCVCSAFNAHRQESGILIHTVYLSVCLLIDT